MATLAERRLDLDMAVYSASRELSLALVRRLTVHTRMLLPEARTVRMAPSDYRPENVVFEICGPYGRVLYSREQQGDLYQIDTGYLIASQITEDADMIVRLAPPKGWPWIRPLASMREWSIKLQQT